MLAPMLLWNKLLDSKLFIVLVIALFAITISALFTLSKSVETQSLQEQKSLTPALSLVVQEIMKPLYVAETIAKVSPLKDWLNQSTLDTEEVHAKLTELSKEFDMEFFMASEKTRKKGKVSIKPIQLTTEQMKSLTDAPLISQHNRSDINVANLAY